MGLQTFLIAYSLILTSAANLNGRRFYKRTDSCDKKHQKYETKSSQKLMTMLKKFRLLLCVIMTKIRRRKQNNDQASSQESRLTIK